MVYRLKRRQHVITADGSQRGNIRVSLVSSRTASRDEGAGAAAVAQLGRVGTPDEIAKAVVSSASDDRSYGDRTRLRRRALIRRALGQQSL